MCSESDGRGLLMFVARNNSRSSLPRLLCQRRSSFSNVPTSPFRSNGWDKLLPFPPPPFASMLLVHHSLCLSLLLVAMTPGRGGRHQDGQREGCIRLRHYYLGAARAKCLRSAITSVPVTLREVRPRPGKMSEGSTPSASLFGL